MESKRKFRKPQMQSSSSSDDDSSSSSSSDDRRKKYRGMKKNRNSSSDSSSEEDVKRKAHRHQHKKSSSRKHLHSSKMRTKMLAANAKKELQTISPSSKSSHKHHLKEKSIKKSKTIDEHERHTSRRDEMMDSGSRIRVSIPNNRAQERSRRKESSPRHYHKEKLNRFHPDEQEHYKYVPKGEDRMSRAQITPERHHHQHEHTRSQSRGRIMKRDEYEMMRGEPRNMGPERSGYSDDRRIAEYAEVSPRMYEERGRRIGPGVEHSRRNFESSSSWDSHPHEKKRPMYDAPYNPKWSKEKPPHE